MYNFTPVTSLIGGILIGLSASAMLLLDGKIAGISGILAGVIRPVKGEAAWKASFTAGLLAGGLLLRLILPGAFAFGVTRSWPVLMMAGLMVGFGARLGNGCTSGHGVCGVSRLSARSIVATGTFMITGALAVFIMNHLVRG